MIRFKLLGTVAALLTLIAAQPQAYGVEGREVVAPPWSAACMSDQGPRECGEPMWVYGGGGAELLPGIDGRSATARREQARKKAAY
jgi:hypothetical protein